MIRNAEEKFRKLKMFQDETVAEIEEKLKLYNKACFVRPTGFGKTYILVARVINKYLKEHPDKRVLYMAPLNIIKDSIETDYLSKGNKFKIPTKYKERIDFYNYGYLTKLVNSSNDSKYFEKLLADNKIGLIVLDEMHSAGSDSFFSQWDSVKNYINKNGVQLVGATASPYRMDEGKEVDGVAKENVIEYIFGTESLVSAFTLSQAIREGILPEIVYKATPSSIDDLLENITNKENVDAAKDIIRAQFKNRINFEDDEYKALVEALKEAGYSSKKTGYYRFIIFCSGAEDITEKIIPIEMLFNRAMNENGGYQTFNKNGKRFNIRTRVVMSSTPDEKLKTIIEDSPHRALCHETNRKFEELIKPKENTIDVIFNINMINMGYHPSIVSGVFLTRGTKSQIVYIQQMGRAISVMAEYNPIIIDCSSNISIMKLITELNKHKSKNKNKAQLTGAGGNTEIPSLEDELAEIITGEYIDVCDDLLKTLDQLAGSKADKYIKLDDAVFLYENRQMPIVYISLLTGLKQKEIVNELIRRGHDEIRKEDETLNLIHDTLRELLNKLTNLEYGMAITVKNGDDKLYFNKAECKQVIKKYYTVAKKLNTSKPFRLTGEEKKLLGK